MVMVTVTMKRHTMQCTTAMADMRCNETSHPTLYIVLAMAIAKVQMRDDIPHHAKTMMVAVT